jgi:hypothetical protein
LESNNYDIFEILPDGAPMWRCTVSDQKTAIAEMESLGKSCRNELIAVHLSSSRIVARKAASDGTAIAAPSGNGHRNAGSAN